MWSELIGEQQLHLAPFFLKGLRLSAFSDSLHFKKPEIKPFFGH
jgi:hypothetical protein